MNKELKNLVRKFKSTRGRKPEATIKVPGMSKPLYNKLVRQLGDMPAGYVLSEKMKELVR